MYLVKHFQIKKELTPWLSGLLATSLLAGVGYTAYSQLTVKSSRETRGREKTVAVERVNLPITISANGTIVPERSVNVSPKTSGMLKSLLVKEGDKVEQGQILAYMDDSNLQGQLTQTRGQLAAAEANLEKLVNGTRSQDIAVAKAVLAEQQASLEKLVNGNRTQDIAVAEAALAEQQATLQKLLNGNRTQDIAVAEAQLAEQQANLQKLLKGNRPEDIAQAIAQLRDAEYAKNQAEEDFQRNQELYNAGAIALQVVNNSRTARDRSQTQVRQAEQAVALLQAGARPEEIASARAAVEQKRQALTLARSGARPEEIAAGRAAVEQKRQALALARSGARPEDIAGGQAAVEQKQQALALLEAGSRPEDIAQARAQVLAARGSLQSVQAQVNDTVLRAPFTGTVTRKYADPGAFVTPTTAGSAVSSATSSSILSLASKNQLVANVAETNISQIRMGQAASIQADAFAGKTFTGKITQISPQSIVQQNVTSFEVKAAIINDDKQILRSGMNVNVEFKAGELKNVLVVPTAAIVRQQRETGVFVAGGEDGKPAFMPIKTGMTVDDKTEVRSGLKGNEKVLLSFPPGLRPRSQNPSPGGIPGLQPGGGTRLR
ncbi:efflux RND transporter periplasmic adaptor subunit [Microcoleus sp. T3_A4]|uniref:efflux RND transporter periplasmic adaptor subunit n=1 Tax=Microcoleus sp. T3_A4 TaxID=2818968 RepID=UPI002FCF6B6A